MSERARLSAVLAAALLACGCASPFAQRAEPEQDRARAYADFVIGQVATRRADFATAADRLHAALEGRADPSAELIEHAVRASLAAGQFDRAQVLSRRFEGDGQTPSVLLLRRARALSEERWGAARRNAEDAQATLSSLFGDRLISAWARAGEGRGAAAAAELQSISVPRPLSGVFAYQRALLLDYAGANEEALSAYDAAAGEGLFLAPATARHANLLLRLGRREEAAAVLARATALATNGDILLAQRRVRGEAPPAPALTPARGAALGFLSLGGIVVTEDPEGGLVLLAVALALDPDLDGARMAFAEGERRAQQYAAARRSFEAIAPQSPYREAARISIALMLQEQGRADEALSEAQRAAAQGGAATQQVLADLYRNAGRYDEADAIYTRLIGATGQDWRIYFARGAARERQGRWRDAEGDFRRALSLSPDQPEVLNYLGYSLVDRGERLEEGLALVRRAAELRPSSGAILDSLGWAQFRMGRYREAATILERAVEIEPADPVLNDHLGDAYWRLGRRVEARFQWRRVLALSPSPELAQAVQRKLEEGLPAARAP